VMTGSRAGSRVTGQNGLRVWPVIHFDRRCDGYR
jgi:hypothetical protein